MSGPGQEVAVVLEDVAKQAGPALAEDFAGAYKGILHETAEGLEGNAKRVLEHEASAAGNFTSIVEGDGGGALSSAESEAGNLEGSATRAAGQGEGSSALGGGDPAAESTPLQCRPGSKDPVDLVHGEMYLPQRDLILPGSLPLLLERMHASNYRKGRWFGPSWASTLDQRLEIDDDGIHYAGPDCVVLHYPVPSQPGRRVLPSHGSRWPLTWDRSSDTIRIEQPESGRTLHFPPGPTPRTARPLDAISDRNGNRVVFRYDEEGVPTGILHSGGYRLAIESTGTRAGTRIEALRLESAAPGAGTSGLGTSALGTSGLGVLVTRFGYDALGRLVEVVNSSGLPQIFEYDDAERMTAWTDRNGNRYEYHYDESGRVVRAGGTGGFLNVSFDYDTTARTTAQTDSLGHRTVLRWNDAGQVVSVTDALGAQTHTERDRYGRVLARTDALGRTVRYTLSEDGDPVRVEHPGGRVVTVEYDQRRRPVRMTRPDGAVWSYARDERGNITAVTDPSGATTAHTLDDRGHLSSITDALGAASRYQTNAAGLPTLIVDPNGAAVRVEYDAFGNPSTITDPSGQATRLGWTVEGKPAWREAADGTREEWTYDGEGNLVEHKDPAGAVTRYEYGPFDKVTARTDPSGARYTFTYDTELRLTAVTGPTGLVWRYEYDAAGRLVRETDFEGRALRYAFDAAGRLIERTNGAGQTVAFVRDERGQLAERRADGEISRFVHDADGRLLRAEQAGSVIEYEYDALGRITAETVDGRTLTYQYDATGRRVRRVTPTGAVSTWEYDPAGLPRSLAAAGGWLTFQRDAAGREISRYIGSGAALSRSYDAAGRLSGLAVWAYDQPAADRPDPRLVHQRTYSYRDDGYPLVIEDSLRGGRAFELDPLGRVTAVSGASWMERYAYDALGNLVEARDPLASDGDAATAAVVVGDDEFGREYEGTRLRRAGRTRYEHDAQGRIIRVLRRTLSGQTRETTYAWDAHDRLVRVITPDGAIWQYSYDPIGRRTAKRRLDAEGVIVEEIRFAWDGTRLAEQLTTTPDGRVKAVAWDWLPGTSTPVTQIERCWPAAQATPSGEQQTQAAIDTAFFAIVADLVGTPTELVTPEGRIAWHTTSALWGRTVTAPDSETDCPLRFPGQYHDAETGLCYNLFRYYDPEAGGYASCDPWRLAAGPNSRAYVLNPLALADPLGLLTYGMCDLNDPNEEIAQVSMAARMQHGVSPGQNVAVYRIGEPPNHSYLAAANDPGGLHSEEILNNYIDDPANSLSRDDVTAIYSEREPCVQPASAAVQHNCAATLRNYPNAQNDIQFSLSQDYGNMARKNAASIAYAMGTYPGVPSGLPGYTWV